MFDIGFIELLVVFVVGLIVIGPEKLPETIRSITMFTSRIKRSIATAKAEIEREVGADDIRRQIHNHDVMTKLNESKEAIENTFKEGMPPPLVDELDPVTGELKSTIEAAKKAADSTTDNEQLPNESSAQSSSHEPSTDASDLDKDNSKSDPKS